MLDSFIPVVFPSVAAIPRGQRKTGQTPDPIRSWCGGFVLFVAAFPDSAAECTRRYGYVHRLQRVEAGILAMIDASKMNSLDLRISAGIDPADSNHPRRVDPAWRATSGAVVSKSMEKMPKIQTAGEDEFAKGEWELS